MSSSKSYRITSDKFPGLAKLVEECGEVVKDGAKIMGGCKEPGLVGHLTDEMGDVYAALKFLVDHNPAIEWDRILARAEEKTARWTDKRAAVRCGV